MKRRRAKSVAVAAVAILALSQTACGSSDEASDTPDAATARAQIEKYQAYLEENAELVVDWTAKMRGQIAVGDYGRAASRYATARVQFGQIEPVARTMTGLYRRINVHAEQVPAAEFGGYHKIERTLFIKETTKGLKPGAKQLLDDVEELQRKIETLNLRPIQIVRDAEGMLKEVSTSRLAGKEEPYSHIDLVDIAANVEGAEAGFNAVKSMLDDKALAAAIEGQFESAYRALKVWGLAAREPQTRPAAAGARFSSFTELTPADIRALAAPIDELSALLARVPSQIASNE